MDELPAKAEEVIRLPERVSKCLIVKPSSLGDIIHSLPFLSALRARFPDAEIHWLVASEFSSLLEGHPMIDRVWSINMSQWKNPAVLPSTMVEIYRKTLSLRAERYDLVVDLQGLFRSAMATLLSGAPARVGFTEAREGAPHFYNHRVNGGTDIHAVERYLKVAYALGCNTESIEFPMPYEDYALPGLPSGQYAVIVPGARWESKVWPAENYGALASLLPVKSVIVGSSADNERAVLVERHSMGKAMDITGKTSLKELSGVIRNSSFMVTNDSGPMHIAAAFGVPVYAIFGPTSPERTGPYGKGHTILSSDEPCAPCFKKRCDDLKCMEGVSPSDVLEAIKSNPNISF
ncbi:MAG: lipopolysaccharide heptosyltransferase I [Thermodesulfovibrionales bacterium]|nr:lipopolysaccharide heptosyltransferase I [Thermodesulfovibrionales bacterium]